MSALTQLEQIRQSTTAKPHALSVARTRLTQTLRAAATFPGALRTFRSGSLATGFVNDPVQDGDGGLVIDRRKCPNLGPDGQGDLPQEVVATLRGHLRPILTLRYPRLRLDTSKRGLLIRFNEPLASGEDPTVDLVVALNRVRDNALWIPNLDENRWDPSDPEKHKVLFTSGWETLRRTRRHVVRVAKAQIKQFSAPTVCSFHIATLAWESTVTAEPLDRALYRFYDYAATELSHRFTEDPAGVSEPIRVSNGDRAARHFRRIADAIGRAIDAGEDDRRVSEALGAFGVFWKLMPQLSGSSPSAIHQAFTAGTPLGVTASGRLTTEAENGNPVVKPTRAYGGLRVRQATGPWYGRFSDRLTFERGAKSRYPSLVSLTRRRGRGWEYRLVVNPPGSDSRRLTIEFPLQHPRLPIVRADGPASSPHRYEDGSLCMWYPSDPRDRRWVFSDGLVALIGCAQAHLSKEALWREWCEWPGSEVPHTTSGAHSAV